MPHRPHLKFGGIDVPFHLKRVFRCCSLKGICPSTRSHRSHGSHRTHHSSSHHPDLHRDWGAIHWPWTTHRSRRPRPHGVEPGTVASASSPHLSATATTTLELKRSNSQERITLQRWQIRDADFQKQKLPGLAAVVKQQQEEISRNHAPSLSAVSVHSC